jgi:hypothetical protein
MLDARNFIGGVCQFNSLVTRRFGSGVNWLSFLSAFLKASDT